MLEHNDKSEAIEGVEFTVERKLFCGLVVYVRNLWKTTPDNKPRPGRWRRATKTELPELMELLRTKSRL